MSTYLEVNYSKEEYGEEDYPQILCNHIITNYLAKHEDVKDKKILDVGSGKGNHLLGFARAGMKPYGIDKRDECVEALKDFEIRSCNIEQDDFPYEDNFFDFVYSKSVIEHVNNTENFFQQASRVLKPGGMGLFMTPDWRSQASHFWDDYTHVRPFTRKSLQNAMAMNGFQNVESNYFIQLPFIWKYPSLKWITDVVATVPESWKWRNKQESDFRPLVRFSKEKMLLAVGIKAHG